MGIDLFYFFQVCMICCLLFSLLLENASKITALICWQFFAQRTSQKKLEKTGESRRRESWHGHNRLSYWYCRFVRWVEQAAANFLFLTDFISLFAWYLVHKDKVCFFLCTFCACFFWDFFLAVKSLHFTGVMVWKWYCVFFMDEDIFYMFYMV